MPWSDGYDGTEAARGSHAQSHLSEICGATTASLQRQEIWHPTMGSSEASWCSWLFLKMLMIHWRIWIGVDSWQHDMFSFQRNDQHRCREAIGNCFSIHRNQGLFSRWKCSSLVNASCHNLLWGQLSHVVFKWGMIHQTDHGICGFVIDVIWCRHIDFVLCLQCLQLAICIFYETSRSHASSL
jgi:hypothetical protein